MTAPTFKQKIGCWWHERRDLERVLRQPVGVRLRGTEWPDLCNRHETVTRCEDGVGRVCQWRDSSLLTVCRFFPATGTRLLRHAWSQGGESPSTPVSILLPVRGKDRLETVSVVAEVLAGQAGPDSEVLICEHDVSPQYGQEWPAGIRSLFIAAADGEAFNKSKAMNAGARAARHPTLVLHDADCIPPPDFLPRSLSLLARGWEAVRPFRFLFLLDEMNSRIFMRTRSLDDLQEIRCVQQNNPGLSTCITREAYMEMGGHDERFEGWGGEDLEFLDRLQTRRIYPGSFLPALHLWHPPAEQKQSGHRNSELLDRIMKEPVAVRIEQDRSRMEGAP